MSADGAESDPLDEWQHLSPSSSPVCLDSVLIRDDYLGEESVFQPSRHEDLVPIPLPQPPLVSSSSSSDDEQQEQEVVLPLDHEVTDDGVGVVTPSPCGVLGAVYRVVRNGSFLSRGAAGIIAVVVASWAFAKFRKLKWLRWKTIRATEESAAVENLIVLLKQKEVRISQLVLQIARMNEVMSAQRGVRVLRVA